MTSRTATAPNSTVKTARRTTSRRAGRVVRRRTRPPSLPPLPGLGGAAPRGWLDERDDVLRRNQAELLRARLDPVGRAQLRDVELELLGHETLRFHAGLEPRLAERRLAEEDLRGDE